MFHVPNGALVVPTSLEDVHAVCKVTSMVPLSARNLPALSARAKMHATTVVVGTSIEVQSAIRTWGSNPIVAVGDGRFETTLTIPSGADFRFLQRTIVPEGVRTFVVGDVHNCHRTLTALLAKLSITPGVPKSSDPLLAFVGDLVDKGGTDPLDPLMTLNLVFTLVNAGQAVVIRGNHEQMLMRRFVGTSPTLPSSHRTLNALRSSPQAARLVQWLSSLPLAVKLPTVEGVEVTVVHANASTKAFESSAKANRHAEQACLFGRATSTPVPGVSIHGHWEVDEVTCTLDDGRLRVNVDTGACLGGKLSAFDATALPKPGKVLAVSVDADVRDIQPNTAMHVQPDVYSCRLTTP